MTRISCELRTVFSNMSTGCVVSFQHFLAQLFCGKAVGLSPTAKPGCRQIIDTHTHTRVGDCPGSAFDSHSTAWSFYVTVGWSSVQAEMIKWIWIVWYHSLIANCASPCQIAGIYLPTSKDCCHLRYSIYPYLSEP